MYNIILLKITRVWIGRDLEAVQAGHCFRDSDWEEPLGWGSWAIEQRGDLMSHSLREMTCSLSVVGVGGEDPAKRKSLKIQKRKWLLIVYSKRD